MKKNSVLVKSMFMSIITAVAVSFTSCSNEDVLSDECMTSETEKSYDGPALEPYGLPYQEYISDGDVQILNSDTTQISVSKQLADKLGIKSFVGHPLGIWQRMEDPAYMRKATREKLIGDRYILDVTECAVAELLNGQSFHMNSDAYVNFDQEAVRSRAASDNIPEYAARYIDDDNVIHPVAVTISPSADSEQDPTRCGLTTYGTFSTEDILMAQMSGSRWTPWGALKDLYDKAKDASTYNIKKYYTDRSLIKFKTTFEKKVEFGVGQKHREKKDTFNVNVSCPIDFAINYNFILDAKGSLVSLPRLNRLEASVAGKFDFAPEVTIGYSKGWELPKDKQRYRLFTFPPVRLTFMIGIVPFTINFDPYIFLKFDASVEGSVHTGIKYHYASHFKFGAEYTNKWNLIKDYDTDENKVTMIPPTLNFKAHAGIGLMLGCDMTVYEVAGPKIAIGPKLTAEAEMNLNQDPKESFFKSSVDFDVAGEIGATIKLWKFELADWKTDFDFGLNYNVFHYNFPHEDGDDSNGSLDNVMKLLMPFKN